MQVNIDIYVFQLDSESKNPGEAVEHSGEVSGLELIVFEMDEEWVELEFVSDEQMDALMVVIIEEMGLLFVFSWNDGTFLW